MAKALEMFGVNTIETAIRSDSASTIKNLLQQRNYLTLLPTFVALDWLERGNLAIVPVGPLPTSSFGVAHHQAIPLTTLCANFVKHSERMLKSYEARSLLMAGDDLLQQTVQYHSNPIPP